MPGSRDSLALVVAVLRATKLSVLVSTSTISVALLVLPLLLGLRNSLRDLDVSVLFHLSLVVSLAGAGFVLDDPAHETLAATPVGRARVAMIRMAAGLCLLMPVWVMQLVLVPQLILTGRQIPVAGLAIEGPILVLCIWAVAALFSRRLDGHASSVAVPAALIGGAMLLFLPEPIALFVNPGSPGFAESRIRFGVLGLVGLVLLIHSLRLRKPRSTSTHSDVPAMSHDSDRR